ncbi:MAG: hypothetical protein ACSHW7_01435 [Patiriisocius sp.]|uniref:hypothetical protein n=1 Tax=Patiriisocius sp. TaxID=2822396 RepID=UPI003EFB36EA
MKTTIIVLVTFLISLSNFAQNGINYKALIKDANGDMIANQAIVVQFSILEAGTTNVYQETQNPTTDDNGIITVNIGEGTVDSGNFLTIDWGANNHFLNVQADTGDGLVDLGTTAFKSVPYAKLAEKVKNEEKFELGKVPVGAIVAWHGSLSNVGPLSSEWKLCNGAVINDPESPLDGQLTPNLNGALLTSTGLIVRGRFLRGGASSGMLEVDSVNRITNITNSTGQTNTQNISIPTSGQSVPIANTVGGLTSPATHSTRYTVSNQENRPVNMSVIWIIRIK